MFLLVEVRNLFNQKKEKEMRMICLELKIQILKWLYKLQKYSRSRFHRKIAINLYDTAVEIITRKKKISSKKRRNYGE